MTRDINNMAIMKSIKPKYCELIIAGKKTIELRKSRPKVPPPVKVYIYCTMPKCEDDIIFNEFEALNGKVIGEFICNKIDQIHIPTELMYEKGIIEFSKRTLDILNQSCLSYEDMINYSGCSLDNYNPRKEYLYGWHISDLIMYDKPKDLSQFIYLCPEFEKSSFTAKCRKCKHYFQNDIDMVFECDCEGEKRLIRPPQSWCYCVEE